MSNIHILYDNNDNILEVDGLKNDLTGVFLNTATVTVTLKDATGAEVAGDIWPKAMEYLDASNGIYRTTLPYSLVMTAGSRYSAVIAADGGAGLHAEWTVECVCRARN